MQAGESCWAPYRFRKVVLLLLLFLERSKDETRRGYELLDVKQIAMFILKHSR